jgi:ABC-type dipeptide/oligopeptide/nickel transport system ATPase component
MADSAPVLRVEDVHVSISSKKKSIQILKGVSVDLTMGEMSGLVGETGSGKSMTARAIMGLLPPGGAVTAGRVMLGDRDLVGLTEDELSEVRGPIIGMVFQNPRTALYPLITVEAQMGNVIKAHSDLGKRERRARVRDYLALAGIPDPARIARAYPHELSGGLAQRVVIATALVSDPSILIADEPTTGLDATIQRQILQLIADLQTKLGLSVLMITHDLGIVAQYCDTVSVMNNGLIVEQGTKHDVLLNAEDEYTQQLIAASRLVDVRAEIDNPVRKASE